MGSSHPGKPHRDHDEEARAQSSVARLAEAPSAAYELVRVLTRHQAMGGSLPRNLLDTLEPYTGRLPSDMILRTGASVDRSLTAQRARGLATGNEVWVGGPTLVRSPTEFVGVFTHEATHVATGGSRAAEPPHFDVADPLPGSWYEIEQARRAELEAAETGEGRAQTLSRLASMSDQDVRRDAPGIAYRAQDRGDIELAGAAAERLLTAWLASSDAPASFTAGFGPEDRVDTLIERAETAFGAGQLELGGTYLSIAIVQLVRAARAAVLARTPVSDDPVLETVRGMMAVMQQSQETEILQRIQRVRTVLEAKGSDVLAQGNQTEIAKFEAIAESVHSVERQAGPPIVEDLGVSGVPEPSAPAPTSGGARRRGSVPTRESAPEVTPPPQPSPTPEAPVSRAGESIVNETHPDLEGALVIYSTAPMTYGNIRSPRYAVAGTFSGAHRMASELFGRRSCVIVEDIHARDERTRTRQIRYLVLALTLRINPPNQELGQEGQIIEIGNIKMLLRPSSSQYFFLAVTSGSWDFFPPALLAYVQQVQARERGVEATTLDPEARREAVFNPIDNLIDNDEIQDAANQLTYVGAEGFALVDTTTKIRYITTLLRAFTFEANEKTVVEVFRSLRGADELREVLQGLQREGVLRQLHTDLESAFSTLLIVVGQVVGAQAISDTQVRSLMSELRILTVFPGLEIRGDGTVALNLDIVGEFKAAFEGLISTISSAVTGIIDILVDPETFLKGIAQLVYFAMMADLASKGFPPAIQYVNRVLSGIARQIGAALGGLAALQESMPEGEEFVRDLQRSVEWRIIWEVVGLFVGVGEAVALVDAIRGGRAAAAVSEVASGLSRTTRIAHGAEEMTEAARLAERGVEAARIGDEVVEDVGRAGRVTEASGESAGATRAVSAVEETAMERSVHEAAQRSGAEVQLADGTHGVAVAGSGPMHGLYFCSDNCALLADKLDALLQALPENYPGREVFSGLRTRAAAADESLRLGRMTTEEADRIAAELAGELNRMAPDSPGVGRVLDMAPDVIRAEAATLRIELAERLNIGTYNTRIRWGIHDIEARPHVSIEGAYWGRRSPQSNPRVDAYELKINPNDESFFLSHPGGGFVQFENLAGTTLVQDGKLVMSSRSIYHVADMPSFARRQVLTEARRQVEAASQAGLRVEWLISEPNALQQLTDLFQAENIAIIVNLLAE